MSTTEAPISFYLDDDFKVLVGKEKKLITIPRLTYANAKAVVGIVSKFMADDTAESVVGSVKGKKVGVMGEAALSDFTDYVRKIIPKLMEKQNVEIVGEILTAVSDGVLKKNILDQMQYEEACKLGEYLITRNFEALKNFSASLRVISTSEK